MERQGQSDKIVPCATAFCAALLAVGLGVRVEAGVEVVPHDDTSRIEIRIDGRPFTEYRYEPALKKPILFPLRTDRGTTITRGFPLDPRPDERVDHPHHAGLWFDYGDVNGVDFWNNSDSSARTAEMGTIFHRAVRRAEGGRDRGVLEVELEWVLPDGTPVLREQAQIVFSKEKRTRAIDRITTLTALLDRVALNDNKEGLLGLRVARGLEHVTGKAAKLTGPDGKPGPERLAETGVTGRYHTSEGKEGAEAWGTRGRWASLVGELDGQPVTVAILDHPKNPGFPTYWHARDYGLFAANPLGQAAFSDGRETLGLTLTRGQSVTFRHRVLIVSRREAPKAIEKAYQRFTRAVD